MIIVDKKSGYDAKLQSDFKSVTFENDGHLFDVSQDRYGIHISIDGRPCKSFTNEQQIVIQRIINTE